MACEQVKVTVSADEIYTLDEIAKELKAGRSWVDVEVDAENGYVIFTENGERRCLATNGNIYLFDEKEEEPIGDELEWLDLAEEMDCQAILWATNEDGDIVAIHN